MSVGAISSTETNSEMHLCFVRTSLSGSLLSERPSAALCHTATACNGVLVERFNPYSHITVCLLCWRKETGGITFGAAPIGSVLLPDNVGAFVQKRTHHFRARKYAASTCCLASLMLLRRSESDSTSEPSSPKGGNKKKLKICCMCTRSSTPHCITFPLCV